jgi:hypothetical protein
MNEDHDDDFLEPPEDERALAAWHRHRSSSLYRGEDRERWIEEYHLRRLRSWRHPALRFVRTEQYLDLHRQTEGYAE